MFSRADTLMLLQFYNVVATFRNIYRILQYYSAMSMQRSFNFLVLYGNIHPGHLVALLRMSLYYPKYACGLQYSS